MPIALRTTFGRERLIDAKAEQDQYESETVSPEEALAPSSQER